VKASGFVDLHTHGAEGYDTRTGDPLVIRKLACAHGSAGTRAILPTIYPGPVETMRAQMKAVRSAMEMQAAQASSLGCAEALILGVHLEGPFLNPERCGALDTRYFARPSISTLKRLIGGCEDMVRVMTVAPEMPGALALVKRCADAGIRVNMGHSDASFEQAAKGKKAGAAGVTHLFNAMRPFHHREPGIAAFALMDEDLYVEVIADGVHLHPRTLEFIFGRKRLDRIMVVSDTVKWRGRKSAAGRRAAGTAARLTGSRTFLSGAAAVLAEIGIPEAEIVEATVDNPARYLNVRPADLPCPADSRA
jgi:N-acetylglucosamine-6-phosphate deacetylase